MVVRDRNGDEHPLEVGHLVMWHPESAKANRFAWMGRVFEIKGPWACCQCPIQKGTADFQALDLLLVSRDPPLLKEGAVTLDTRRLNFLNNLDRAMGKVKSESDGNLLYQIKRKLTYPNRDDNTWFWNSIAESFDDPRQISYASKPEYYDNDTRRSRCSISKFLKGAAKKIGGWDALTDDMADRIAKLIGDTFPNSYDYSFEVVRGKDLKPVYWGPETSGFGSCMYRKKSINWYCDNPDTVGALRILQGGDLVGRALLWNTDQGATVLDRIYPSNNGPHIGVATAYARSQGWDYKLYQRSSAGDLASERMDYTVTMKPSKHGYPYMDTFKYSGSNPDTDEQIVMGLLLDQAIFTSTEGDYHRQRLRCHDCGITVNNRSDLTLRGAWALCRDCFDGVVDLNYETSDGERVQGRYDREDTAPCYNCCSRVLPEHLVGVGGRCWCPRCVDSQSFRCSECGDTRPSDDRWTAADREDVAYCPPCGRSILVECDSCCEFYHRPEMLDCTGSQGRGGPVCFGCAEIQLENYVVDWSDPTEYWPLDGERPEPVDMGPVAEAPPVEAPAPEPAPAVDPQYDYPHESFSYNPACGCLTCVAIRARRTREARDMYCSCSACRPRIVERTREFVNAPYPNDFERRELDRRADAIGTVTRELVEA